MSQFSLDLKCIWVCVQEIYLHTNNNDISVHVDTHRIRVDAGDLFIVFADFVRNAKGILNGTLVVDQDSLEIQGILFTTLYL